MHFHKSTDVQRVINR